MFSNKSARTSGLTGKICDSLWSYIPPVAPWATFVPEGIALVDWAAIAALPPQPAREEACIEVKPVFPHVAPPTVGPAWLSRQALVKYKAPGLKVTQRLRRKTAINNFNNSIKIEKVTFARHQSSFKGVGLADQLKYKGLRDPLSFKLKYLNIIYGRNPRPFIGPLTSQQYFNSTVRYIWRAFVERALDLEVRQAIDKAYKKISFKKLVYNNFNNFSLLEDESLPTPPHIEEESSSSTDDRLVGEATKRSSRRREIPLPKWDKKSRLFEQPKLRSRSRELLEKLRARLRPQYKIIISRNICSLRRAIFLNSISESVAYIRQMGIDLNFKFKHLDHAIPKPQADDGVRETTNENCEVETQRSGNVVLTTQREESCMTTPRVLVPDALIAGEQEHVFPTLQDRWILIDNFKWEQQAAGTVLKEWIFPAKILDLKPDVVNTLPFKTFSFWRGDMEFKIQINANKVQVGSLQISWLYDTIADSKAELRRNLYSLSQAPHTLINAGSDNPACLYIGYQNPYPSLPIIRTREDSVCLNLGTLRVLVLNQLQSTSSTNNKCEVSVFMRFVNSKFYGMRASTIGKTVQPQMMEGAAAMVAVGAAERALNMILPESNRDNPPYTGARPAMVPQAVQSICTGSGATAPLNPLRLDARGQTPHLQSDADEMSVSTVAQKFGLVTTLEWTADLTSGSVLWRADAAPCFDPVRYPYVKEQSNTCYYIPPVAVVSSLYSYWRGSLEARFDIVGSSMHTGRLIVAYVPRCEDNITLAQAVGGPHISYDLKECQSFTFKIPYITNRYWWPRRVGFINKSDMQAPPGRIHVFVQNALVANDIIPNKVYLNVYWRGGPDFAVAVPAQPSFGTAFFTTNDQPTKQTRAEDGYWPWYWGYYESFFGGKKAIARYGKGWGHVAQFFNIAEHAYYTPNEKSKKDFPIMYKNDGTKFQPQFFAPLPAIDTAEPAYMGVIETEENAKKYASLTWKEKLEFLQLFMDVQDNDNGPWCNGNPVFDEHIVPPADLHSFHLIDHTSVPTAQSAYRQVEYFAKPQADERDQSATLLQPMPIASVESGITTFGENFQDLKDLCRRYQPYTTVLFSDAPEVGKASFVLPIVPQGLDLKIQEKEKQRQYYQKYVRDGTIPIILSGYRFFRGSIRLQIVWDITGKNKSLGVWVQHKPDYHGDSWVVDISKAINGGNLYNTGYASNIQATQVNNVVAVEVPFYQPLTYTYLQRTNLKKDHAYVASDLGVLNCGIEGAIGGTGCAIMYALGDDARAFCFQGFPPMIPLDTLPSPTTRSFTGRSRIPRYVQPQGLFDWIGPAKVEVSVNQQSVQQAANTAVETVAQNSKFSEILSSITKTISELTKGAISIGIDIVSAICHYIINPTLKCLIIAIVTLFLKLGLINTAVVDYFTAALERFLVWLGWYSEEDCRRHNTERVRSKPSTSAPSSMVQLTPATPSTSKEDTDVMPPIKIAPPAPKVDVATGSAAPKPQADDDDPVMSYINVGFMAISSVLGTIVSPPKDLKGLSNLITRDLSASLRSANFLHTFLKNNITFFKNIIQRVTLKSNKDKIIELMLEAELHPMVEWCEECQVLLDYKNDEKTFATDSRWADRLEYAYVIGCKLNKHFADDKAKSSVLKAPYAVFRDLFQKICKKREQMLQRGISAVSRREPFCVYIHGSAGCGKSQLASTTISNLLADAGVEYTGEPIFTLSSGAKWWNGCRHQPAIYMDDFLNVRSGETGENAVRDFFAVKSPAVLNPPQAHVELKEARYAPEICWMNSNYSHPTIPNVNDEALWRRRDVLVEVAFHPELEAVGVRSLTADRTLASDTCAKYGIDMSKYDHLRFRFWRAPEYPLDGQDEWIRYDEFYEIIRNKFVTYRVHQQRLFDERVKAINATMQKHEDEDIMSLVEKRTRYKKMMHFMKTYSPGGDMDFQEYMLIVKTYCDDQAISQELVDRLITFTQKNDPVPQGPEFHVPQPEQDLCAVIDSVAGIIPSDRPAKENIIAAIEFINKKYNLQLDIEGTLDTAKLSDFAVIRFIVCSLAEVSDMSGFTLNGRAFNQLEVTKLMYIFLTVRALQEPSDASESHTLREHFELFFETIQKGLACHTKTYEYLMQFLANVIKQEKRCLHYLFDKNWDWDTESQEFVSNIADLRVPDGPCTNEYCLWREPPIHNMSTGTWYFNQPDFANMLNETKPPSVFKRWSRDCYSIVETRDVGTDANDKRFYRMCKTVDKLKEELNAANLELAKRNIYIGKEVGTETEPPPTTADGSSQDGERLKWMSKEERFSFFNKYTPSKLRFFWAFATFAGVILAVFGMYFGVAWMMGWSHPAAIAAVATADGVGAGAGIAAGACAVGCVVNAATGPSPETKAYTPDKTTKSGGKAKPAPAAYAKPQSGWPEINEQLQATLKIVQGNTYYMRGIVPGEGYTCDARILLLCENIGLALKHYLKMFESRGITHVQLSTYGRKSVSTYRITDLSVTGQEDSDLCFIKFPGLRMHRDVTKHIKSASSHDGTARLCYMFEAFIDQIPILHPVEVEMIENVTSQSPTLGSYEMQWAYAYSWEGKGRCGSILLDPQGCKPIMGVHAAGAPGAGYAIPLVAESFSAWNPINIEGKVVGCNNEPRASDKFEGDYVPIGQCDSGMAHPQSGETRIVKTRCHGRIFGEPVTAPAPLRKGDPRVEVPEGVVYSPLYAGVANMMKPTLNFNSEHIKIIKEAKRVRLLSLCTPVINFSGPQSLQVAVCGLPGDYFTPMDMSTSEGFPLSRYRPPGASNKAWLFQLEDDPSTGLRVLTGMERILYDMHNFKMDLRNKGTIPTSVFDDCLKDARIPKEKIKIPGKTRIFSTSPVEYTIACKRYFGDFQAAYKKARINLSHAIGIAADGPEWGKLVRYLTSIPGVYVTGDYSNFGPSLNHQVLEAAAMNILEWYRQYDSDYLKHHLARKCLIYEGIHALHCTYDKIWQATSGLPSGCALTVEWNSEVNEFYVMLAWMDIFQDDPEMCSLDNFYKHTRLITYGDDLIMTVSYEVCERFNNLTLQQFFSKFNIKFTDASKAGNKPYETQLSKCSFLKRSFSKHPLLDGEWLAPLDEIAVVREIPNWTHKCKDIRAATLVSLEASNTAAYGLGPTKFQIIHEQLNSWVVMLEAKTYLRSWTELDCIFFSDKYALTKVVAPSYGDDVTTQNFK
ncbi:replicase [Halyomorpha halys ifla-like virus 1]|nr:replicase [Halyomorpha halys ifla-like virus 1]